MLSCNSAVSHGFVFAWILFCVQCQLQARRWPGFQALPNSFCMQKNNLPVTTTFAHKERDSEITGINESFPLAYTSLETTHRKKSYLILFLVSIETGEDKYTPWQGF